MVYPVTYTFAAANTTYVALAQTRNGSGALTLNGSGVDQMSTYLLNNPRMKLSTSGFERTISITAAGVTSTVTFTITGKDIRGAALIENVTGPNTTTSYTAGYFYEVNSVTANGTAANVSVGIGTTGRSQWYKPDYNMNPTNLGLGVTVSGTDLTWTVVQTTYNVETAEPAANSIINNSDTNLVAQTTSRQGNYVIPFGATRCNVTASTNGTLVFNIYQSGSG